MKKEDLIRNLKAELTKLEKTKKTYDTFETRYDLMIEDVLNYIENSIPKKKIENEIEILKAQCGGNPYHIQQTLNANIRLLQELLEDK